MTPPTGKSAGSTQAEPDAAWYALTPDEKTAQLELSAVLLETKKVRRLTDAQNTAFAAVLRAAVAPLTDKSALFTAANGRYTKQLALRNRLVDAARVEGVSASTPL